MVFKKFARGFGAIIVFAVAVWWCSVVPMELWKWWNVNGDPWLSVNAQIISPVASRYF
jgi:hypothetical protein